MNQRSRLLTFVQTAALTALLGLVGPLSPAAAYQPPGPLPGEGVIPGDRVEAAAAGEARLLPPGVLRTVVPEVRPDETYSRHDIFELLAVDEGFDWARDVRFSHPVWCLEFSYKAVRFIDVDVAAVDGGIDRKRVWYLVYRVRNLGDEPVPFVPIFELESFDVGRIYPDRFIATALPAIEARERIGVTLHDTVAISGELPPSGEDDEGLWGVAMWTDVDPRTDTFAIRVQGLSNSYQWRDDPDGPDGPVRRFVRKVLQLNFWRPGDEFDDSEAAIRIGRPGELDYVWVYR